MLDEQNICLKCKYGYVSGTKKKDLETGKWFSRCECRYADGMGKNAGYRKLCKTFKDKECK